MQWLNLVNIVMVAWAVFLRRQEIVNLRLCDLTWEADKLRVWVQNTKNDKQGEGRESLVHAEEKTSDCRGLMEEIKNGLLAVHGTLARSAKCTKESAPTRRCQHCRPVFPSINANKRNAYPIPHSSLPKLIKKGYQWLEQRGAVTKGKHKKISTSSLRRGGNTMAAAEGIRQTVRAKHGRWRMRLLRRSTTGWHQVRRGECQGHSTTGWDVHGAKGKEAAAARAVAQRGAAQAATLPSRVTGASEHVTRYAWGVSGLSHW